MFLPLVSSSLWDTGPSIELTLQQIWQKSLKCWELQGKHSCSIVSFLYKEKQTACLFFLAPVCWALGGLPFCPFEHPVLLPGCFRVPVTSKPLFWISTITAFSYCWRKGWLLTTNFTYVQTKNALCGLPLAFVSLFCRICFSHQPAEGCQGLILPMWCWICQSNSELRTENIFLHDKSDLLTGKR